DIHDWKQLLQSHITRAGGGEKKRRARSAAADAAATAEMEREEEASFQRTLAVHNAKVQQDIANCLRVLAVQFASADAVPASNAGTLLPPCLLDFVEKRVAGDVVEDVPTDEDDE
ncbi:hypothetical protein E4U41_004440, partial [Claviceps citrina]